MEAVGTETRGRPRSYAADLSQLECRQLRRVAGKTYREKINKHTGFLQRKTRAKENHQPIPGNGCWHNKDKPLFNQALIGIPKKVRKKLQALVDWSTSITDLYDIDHWRQFKKGWTGKVKERVDRSEIRDAGIAVLCFLMLKTDIPSFCVTAAPKAGRQPNNIPWKDAAKYFQLSDTRIAAVSAFLQKYGFINVARCNELTDKGWRGRPAVKMIHPALLAYLGFDEKQIEELRQSIYQYRKHQDMVHLATVRRMRMAKEAAGAKKQKKRAQQQNKRNGNGAQKRIDADKPTLDPPNRQAVRESLFKNNPHLRLIPEASIEAIIQKRQDRRRS